jgi:hypothetical protein
MIDFYGLPNDFPGKEESKGMLPFDKAQKIEKAFEADIAQSNFIANLVVHEFEGLLCSSPQAFESWFDESNIVHRLRDVRNQFISPEHINDSISTAPSKRILNICRGYDKVLHGSAIASDIGLDIIRKECPLFDKWIRRLESLPKGNKNSFYANKTTNTKISLQI